MVLRVGGLASGMDIESIVKNLMTAERMPLDKLKQQKQTLEWQRDDYRKINTLLLDFRTELTQMKLTSKYRSSSVTTSNETKVTATAATSAAQASYSISKVDRLASAAYRVGDTVSTSATAKLDAFKTLETQSGKLSTAITWESGAVGSQTLTVGDSDTMISLKLNTDPGFEEKINIAELGKMSVKVNGTAYNVVASGALAANEVTISSTGELIFGSDIAAGASIKVDYITDQRVQKSTLGADATTFQLDRKEINNAGFNLDIGGTSYTLGTLVANDKDERIYELSGGTGGRGTVNLTTGLVTFAGSPVPKDTVITAEFKQNYADFSVSSHTSKGQVTEKFLIQSSESLNQVINKVNSSEAGVSMIYDSFSDKFSITRKETGNYNTDLTVAGNSGYEMGFSGDLVTSLKILKDNSSTDIVEQGGVSAKFTINGMDTERQSNTFEMSGVSITLKSEIKITDGAVNLSVSKDSNAVYDNIKGFIDKYNTLIGAVGSKTSEERYRSYTPLTDDQREQLGDKQQEQWEEKAKSGLLRRDSILTGVVSSMRGNFSQPVSNNETNAMYRQLASIGITTTANYLEGGKLQINEAKLKEAINTNPDAVEALFRGGGDSTSVGEKGIVHRLYDTVNATMDRLKERAGNSFSTNQQFALGRQLSGIDSGIKRFEDRLTQVEDRYWKQFTAMEKAIQQSNSQSSYLMQQFSS